MKSFAPSNWDRFVGEITDYTKHPGVTLRNIDAIYGENTGFRIVENHMVQIYRMLNNGVRPQTNDDIFHEQIKLILANMKNRCNVYGVTYFFANYIGRYRDRYTGQTLQADDVIRQFTEKFLPAWGAAQPTTKPETQSVTRESKTHGEVAKMAYVREMAREGTMNCEEFLQWSRLPYSREQREQIAEIFAEEQEVF